MNPIPERDAPAKVPVTSSPPNSRVLGAKPATPPPGAANVDAFLALQPDDVRHLLAATRAFLHDAVPGLREGIKWRIPTFMLARNLFYLNPQQAAASQTGAVVLGFVNGAAMQEFLGVFDRVQAEVAHVIIRKQADLARPGLREAVRAAAGLPAETVTLSLRANMRPATYEAQPEQPGILHR